METDNTKKDTPFAKIIEEKANLKKLAQENKHSVWSGLRVFGLVGWSVVVPTIVGILLGQWLDTHYLQSFSWTLSLLIVGLLAGCLMAWKWLIKE
jgi:ATP synthase protein I